ncbi:MAG: hypothetical protein ACRC62_02395, partial [Microcoleus sp.]
MKKHILFLFILYLIPVILLIGFVANFSVNVPVDDEWRLAIFFERIATGNIAFKDFWALHSNHRIVFPKIIIAVLAFASQWNINYQLYFSIGLAAITFIALYELSSKQVKNSENLWQIANILTCIWIFSLVQYENWLWGFQLAWFLVNLCFVGAVYALISHQNPLQNIAIFNYIKRSRDAALPCPYPRSVPHYIRISIAAIFCFIASFSLAQGLLSWLAAIPAVVTLEGNAVQKRKRAIVWMLLFVATCAIYAIDYHPSRKTSIISLLNTPLVVIDYFLSLLGSPIVRSPVISALVGFVILAIFGFFAVYFLPVIVSYAFQSPKDAIASSSSAIQEKDASNDAIASFLAMTRGKDASKDAMASFPAMTQEDESSENAIASSLAITQGKDVSDAAIASSFVMTDAALPWLSIGLFSLLSTLFITIGRAQFGAMQAIESSRYTTNSILLLIATIQLGQLFVRKTKVSIARDYKFIYWGLSGLLIAAIIVNSQQAFAQARSAFIYKQGGQDCLQLINYLENSDFFDKSPESCLRVLSKKTWLV